MMSKLRYILLLTAVTVIGLNSNAKTTCSTTNDFQPQWDKYNKTCLLKLTTDAAKDYDLLFDFNQQEFRIAKKNQNINSFDDLAYSEVSFIKFQALNKTMGKSSKNDHYTVLKQNWKNGTSNTVSTSQALPNAIISSYGALSFSAKKPENLKSDTVITLANKEEIKTSDCSEPNQNFLIVNKENKMKIFVPFNFKYTENFSELKSEKDCLAANPNKEPQVKTKEEQPSHAK